MANTKAGYCAECGAAVAGKFCSDCGAPVGRSAQKKSPTPRSMQAMVVTTVVLAIFVVFLIAQRIIDQPQPESIAGPGMAPGATDIASMTPDERASRLYDRVMRYGENGQIDSARFFAPMAIQSYQMLGQLTAHTRYDVGMIHATVGDSVSARAQADTILAERPTHLLGLALAMRVAPGAAARNAFARKLLAASASESASPLPEYADHRGDVDRAVATAAALRP